MHQTFKNIENGDLEKNKNQIRDPKYPKIQKILGP